MSRPALSFSRDLEYATEHELAKRVGAPRPLWLRAVVKELIDNALDSTEEARVEPSIEITIEADSITVADNGPGMSPELVERLCNRAERTSSREGYASPDRGAQGNFLQVAMALPLGFGRGEAVTRIASHGIEHTISLRVNRLEGHLDIARTERAVPVTPGTSVTILWPEPIDRDGVAAVVSQHASVKAFLDLQLGGITLKGCKIVRQEGQKPWLAMPATKSDRGWNNAVEMTKALRERVTPIALEAWQKSLEHAAPPPTAPTTPAAPPPSSRQARDQHIAELARRFDEHPDDSDNL